jgi:hypothetical protein
MRDPGIYATQGQSCIPLQLRAEKPGLQQTSVGDKSLEQLLEN